MQPGEHAKIGRDALTATEAQPYRKDVADDRGEAGEERRRAPEQPAGEKHSRRAFQGVAEKGGKREFAPPRAQNVGRADVAGANGADVAEPGHAREDQAERDRAEQIAESERRRIRPDNAHGSTPPARQGEAYS